MPTQSKSTNKSFIIAILLLGTTVVLCILLVVALFFYYSIYPNINQNTGSNKNIAQTTIAQSTEYSFLVSQQCRSDSSYSNVITSSEDLNAYPYDYFYSKEIKSQVPSGQIKASEKILVDLMYWEDDTKDALNYDARALVCIKDKNKIATISFNSKQVTFASPFRYKDPERKISKILIQAVYMVASDATSKSDWQTKLEANLKNIQLAQNRIFNNNSQIDYVIYPVPVKNSTLSRDFLTNIAKGIVAKDTENANSSKPKDFLESNVYTTINSAQYPAFFKNEAQLSVYDQVSTVVYFEVGNNSKIISTNKFESGYAFVYPAMKNGNFLAIIGVNLNKDISQISSPYHEFMHTLGLPDEYKYSDGTIQRTPTHIFKGKPETFATLMQDPSEATLSQTYIDDQERYMMGLKD